MLIAAPPPAVKAFYPAQQAFRGMGLFPGSGSHLVGLGEGRVGVNGAEDLVQTQVVFHRQDEFGEQIPGMVADDRHTEDLVFAGRG